jgi:hypothetical protein
MARVAAEVGKAEAGRGRMMTTGGRHQAKNLICATRAQRCRHSAPATIKLIADSLTSRYPHRPRQVNRCRDRLGAAGSLHALQVAHDDDPLGGGPLHDDAFPEEGAPKESDGACYGR